MEGICFVVYNPNNRNISRGLGSPKRARALYKFAELEGNQRMYRSRKHIITGVGGPGYGAPIRLPISRVPSIYVHDMDR